MSFGKKIVLLLVLLILLIVYSVFSFDYKTILSKDTRNLEIANEKISSNTENSFMDNLDNLKTKLFSALDLDDTKISSSSIPSSFDLVKEDGNIVLNGMFKDEEEVKKVMETLNVNREGNITYNENCVLDEEMISKLTSLITPFKDFFFNDSKLSLISGELSLDGELKDANYKDLLESIISRVDIELKTNIKEPNVSKTQEIIESIKENINIEDGKEVSSGLEEKIVDVNNTEVKVENIDKKMDKILTSSTISNLSQKSKQIQLEINEISTGNKITFERRSVKITDESYLTVEKIAKLLSTNPTIKIEIAGHTDSRGSSSLNKRISQDRANSVMASLIDLGIDKNRLKAVGYGEDFPIAKDDENGLSEVNRRVEFNIIGE